MIHEDENTTHHSSGESTASEVSSQPEAVSEDEVTSSSDSSSSGMASEDSDAGADEDEGEGEGEGADDRAFAVMFSPSPTSAKELPSAALESRLATFIPQLQQANLELETNVGVAAKQFGRVIVVDDDDDEEEEYIEMHLGLGVVQEDAATDDTTLVKITASEDSDSSASCRESGHEAKAEITEASVVDKLLRLKTMKRKIEEVD